MTKQLKKRIIAPRLFSGERRVSNGHGLPPEIKEALKDIAKDEGKSLSWVLEEVIYDYFKLRRPKFIKRSK